MNMASENGVISLNISEEERPELILFYKTRLEKLENEVLKTQGILKTLGYEGHFRLIDAPVDTGILPEKRDQYRTTWSWTLKIKFVLKEAGKCLTTREIIEGIIQFEPNLVAQNIINSVSGTISTKASKGIVFKRYQDYPGSEYYVGLAEWFDGDQVKPEFQW